MHLLGAFYEIWNDKNITQFKDPPWYDMYVS